jgi:ABC-2 type transport system permease protein
MFKEIFLFELFYRKSRSVTYIYFGITFLLCFLGVASSIIKLGGAVGMIKANAPYVIYRMTLVSSFVLSIITSAIMGVAIVRDFDHNMDGILFSAPIKKSGYLMGRFLGSFVTLLVINLAIPLGFIIGFLVGKYFPWEVAWKSQELLPFNLWNYFHPFVLILIPNLFVTCALFFMSGALGRKTIVIYMQGILLLILYQIGNGYLRDLDSQYLAAIIDPYGIQTFLYTTRYWTPAEQNTLFVSFEGPLLYNRLLWVGVGIFALFITYRFFSFSAVRDALTSKETKLPVAAIPESGLWIVPKVRQIMDANTHLKQIRESSFLYFKMIWKEIPFIAIAGSGILLLFLNASRINSVYGTSSYPTTASILDLMNNSFNLFFLIIVIFYSGELIWKERSVGFNMIIDALPVPSFVNLLSKFIGLLLTYVALILLLIAGGVIIQISYGYFKFDLPVYFGTLFGSTFVGLVLFTLLSFFIQVLANNKFAGFVFSIVFLIVNALLPQVGVEHDLWQFGSGKLGPFSEINLYGHFVTPFVWFKTYWIAFSFVLFVIAVIFSVRGAETQMKLRWKAGKVRFTTLLLLFTTTVLCIFLFSGFYIYYNTNVTNRFEGSHEHAKKLADYERLFNQYGSVTQPKIVESNIAVDLYPSRRDFVAEGYYYLKNKSHQAIHDIHVQYTMDHQLTVDYVKFDHPAKMREGHPRFRHYIYELNDALTPGDSVKMSFKLSFITRGFVGGGSNTDVVYNGTFFNNTYFPRLGYNNHFELSDRDDRKKYGLRDKDQMSPSNNSLEKTTNVFGTEADRIRFEMVVSTASDQTAVAPGYLQQEWKKDNRNYFRYKTDAPICNFYSVVSGRYKVRRDRWRNVNLEIYYHPGHEFNLSTMMKGMKDALDYCADNFSPFQFRQLRILEFPRYQTFAQSYANTIPYSEGIGFILKVKHPDKDLDMAYYVTAHEVAHQWWGQQVIEADARGSAMLSEGLSQYSALMVMKHAFSTEIVERYLKYELDNYLRGRTLEKRKEQPLLSVEHQPYVHYNKSSLIFFALQDYLGEDNLNRALSAFNKQWAFKDAPYPTSSDLLKAIHKVTPDSLLYLLHDMFETVTLFENQTLDAVYKEDKKGKFELTLSVSCEKIRVDSAGQENKIPINDWIDVGVYATDASGKEKLIYLKKHNITKKKNLFVISIGEKPSRAGIDPLHKLIDRHSDDNTINVGQFIEITNLPVEY